MPNCSPTHYAERYYGNPDILVLTLDKLSWLSSVTCFIYALKLLYLLLDGCFLQINLKPSKFIPFIGADEPAYFTHNILGRSKFTQNRPLWPNIALRFPPNFPTLYAISSAVLVSNLRMNLSSF